jgi:adhesin transport system outer membrane protein
MTTSLYRVLGSAAGLMCLAAPQQPSSASQRAEPGQAASAQSDVPAARRGMPAARTGVGSGGAASRQVGTPALSALPQPTSEPQLLRADEDPLIRFLTSSDPAAPFRMEVSSAVETHPRVEESIAAEQEAQGVRSEVRAGLFPQVDVNLTSERSIGREFSNDPDNIIERSRPDRRTDGVVSASQLLYDFGATTNRIKSANAGIEGAEAQIEVTAIQTALQAITAYYDLFGYGKLAELSEGYVARHKSILADTEFRVRQGYGPAADLARVESYVASAEAFVGRYQRQLASARARYAEVFGSPPPARLARPTPPAQIYASYEAAVAASRSAPALAAAEAQAESARQAWRASRAEQLPRVTANLDASKYDVYDRWNADYDVRARVVLRHRILGFGSISSRTDQALARYRQSEFAAEQAGNEVGRDAGIAYRDVQVLEDQVEALKTAYFASRRTRDLFVEQFRVARGSLLELLRAEQDYFQAAANYLEGVIELDVARYVLLARTGALLEDLGVRLQTEQPPSNEPWTPPLRSPAVGPRAVPHG